MGGQTYSRKADRNLKKIVSPEGVGHCGQQFEMHGKKKRKDGMMDKRVCDKIR